MPFKLIVIFFILRCRGLWWHKVLFRQKSWFFFLIFYLYCHTETNRLSCSKEFRNVSFKRKTLFKRIMKAIILIVMLNRKQKSSVENKQISLRRAKITLFLFILCWKRTWNFREIFLTLFECIIQTLSVSVSLLNTLFQIKTSFKTGCVMFKKPS